MELEGQESQSPAFRMISLTICSPEAHAELDMLERSKVSLLDAQHHY